MPNNRRITYLLTALLALFIVTAGPVHQAHAQLDWLSGSKEKDLKDFDTAENLFKAGHYQLAIARVDKFLKKYPDDVGGRMLKAWALLKVDQLDEAKTIIDGVLIEDPKHLDALVATGVYHRKLGDNDTALSYYERVLDIDPNDPYALSSIVTVALLSCEIKKAVDYGERGVKGAPDDAVINANLAVAYHFDGQFDQRDKYTALAKKYNYPRIKDLDGIYSGALLLLPDDCEPNKPQQPAAQKEHVKEAPPTEPDY